MDLVSDFIVIIDKGKILQQGTLNQLLLTESPKGKTIEFTIQNPGLAVQKLFDESQYNVSQEKDNGKRTVSLNQLEEDLPGFLAFLNNSGIRIENLEFRRKTLDDVFISLTGRHLNA